MKAIHTSHAPAAIGPYSQAVSANGLLFLSGQIGIDPAVGKITGKTALEQAEQIFRNIGAILDAAGTGYERVVKTTVFLLDMTVFPEINKLYARYFTSLPARSCVAVSALPAGAQIEVEVIAELPEEKEDK